jgi:hypothetical protein
VLMRAGATIHNSTKKSGKIFYLVLYGEGVDR